METKSKKENEDYLEKPKNGKSIIKFITKNITTFFALIVFFSYLELYEYYHCFGLYISSYSSPYELLIYSIPLFLVSPLNILVKYWFILLGYVIYELVKEKNEKNEPRIVSKIFKSKGFYFYVLIALFIITSTFIFELLSLLFINKTWICFDYVWITKHFIDPNGELAYHIIFMVLFIFWVWFFYNLIMTFINTNNFKISKNIFRLYFLVLVIIIFNSLKNLEYVIQHTDKESRKMQPKYEFVYYKNMNEVTNLTKSESDMRNHDSSLVKSHSERLSEQKSEHENYYEKVITDSIKTIIGETKDYIILKDFNENKVYLYDIKYVRNLVITPNNLKDTFKCK